MYIDEDIDTRICNNFQSGKEISKELQWVSVVLIIQHAKRMRHNLFSSLNYRNVPQYFHINSYTARVCENGYWA